MAYHVEGNTFFSSHVTLAPELGVVHAILVVGHELVAACGMDVM